MNRIHIAVAEDNSADLIRLQTVLNDLGVEYDLTIAVNGEEARDFILKQGRFSNSTRADLILLDVQMPKLTGREVLREISYSADLPVCMLTSSEREKGMDRETFRPQEDKLPREAGGRTRLGKVSPVPRSPASSGGLSSEALR